MSDLSCFSSSFSMCIATICSVFVAAIALKTMVRAICIWHGKIMSVPTSSTNSVSTPKIFFTGHWIKVLGIYADLVQTQVIKFSLSIKDYIFLKFVNHSVSAPVAIGPITSRAHLPNPIPATVFLKFKFDIFMPITVSTFLFGVNSAPHTTIMESAHSRSLSNRASITRVGIVIFALIHRMILPRGNGKWELA